MERPMPTTAASADAIVEDMATALVDARAASGSAGFADLAAAGFGRKLIDRHAAAAIALAKSRATRQVRSGRGA